MENDSILGQVIQLVIRKSLGLSIKWIIHLSGLK